MKRKKRIAFVTGGTGFVGSHLVEELWLRGYDEVRCLVRNHARWLDGITVIKVEAELWETAKLRKALKDVTHVYHVAGLTRAKDPDDLMRANVEGTLQLLRAVRLSAPKVRRVLITSSLAVVGECDEEVATETTPMNPVSHYGRSKAQMENQIKGVDIDGTSYVDLLPITVVRPPAVYGPRERDLFGFFKAASRGICPLITGENADPISFVHVRDVVNGMIDAAETDKAVGEAYFLGSERAYRWNEIKDVTASAIGRKVYTIEVPPPAVKVLGTLLEFGGGLFGRYPALNRDKVSEILKACKACSSEKAREHFGYEPSISLEDGISGTISWYRKEGWLR